MNLNDQWGHRRSRLPSLSSGSGEEQPWRAGTWPSVQGKLSTDGKPQESSWPTPRTGKTDGARVGEEQTESESVISSPGGPKDLANSNHGGGESDSSVRQSEAEDAKPGDNGDCQELGNSKHNGHTSTEECRGTSEEQEEGGCKNRGGHSGSCAEQSDNVPNSEDGGCEGV